jgi:membrane protein involved in colicin uptake
MVDQGYLAEQSAKAAEETRQADEERRKAAVEVAKKGTEAARKASLETLAEQEAMKPVPSQEGCDAIKAGGDPLENEEIEQPDGPAARAAEGRPDVLTRQFEPADESAGTQQRRARGRPPRASYETRTSQPS